MPAPLQDREPRRGPSKSSVVFGLFALIALFFLVTEHRAHLLGALPYVLLLACPVLHLFHRHGAQGPNDERRGPDTGPGGAGALRDIHSHRS
ncbi:DUF2933 domain-containing protein [Aquabacterium sp. A7-Y]|uniref:DUF2933 domain-containing protein n=1 Tax=Aquabacterium sp. A7-Y TaxID=1349605 RepID=UPI00223D1CD0|nr:DUF2933 domain-containing protein [Aquabacterium sp. A7-Y]MCW7541439.1 DUF2933 domain-containing protein [Aquabacterium sp. A7-Y]